MYTITKKKGSANIIWDPKAEKPLCKFTQGFFSTSDKDIADRLIMLRNFVPGDIHNHNQEQIPGDYVLYFGRYDVQKGVPTLLKVCSELDDIPLVFAGSGPLEQTVNETGNVRNVGFVSGAKLHRLIAEARFTIYPSEWYENCPFSVMESQMLGTPVIGTNIGGIPELINTDDAPTGVLVEAGNSDELREAIISLWHDADRCMNYSKNCLLNKWDNLDLQKSRRAIASLLYVTIR